MSHLSSVAYLSILASLAACGGGGGGSTGPGGSGGSGGTGGGGAIQCPAGAICMDASVFVPTSITIQRNGSVTFTNESGILHDVTFPSGAPIGGNIPLHASGSNVRQFTSAGTFTFYCTQHGTPTSGMRGQVVVQ